VFVQWFQLYEFDRSLVSSILSSVGSVFADYVLYAANNDDVVLVATASGAMPPMSDAVFEWPATRSGLSYLDIRTPAQLRTFRLAARRAYAPLLEGGLPNTDYFPSLEFGAARARYLKHNDDTLISLARDPVPVLEMLSGFEPPTLAEFPLQGGHHLARFLDVERAGLIADAIAADSAGAAAKSLLPADAKNLETVRAVRADMSVASWSEWFAALLSVSKPLINNGGAPVLEKLIASDNVARGLRSAPPAIREKVDFLLLVGRRDRDRIRAQGARLLGTPLAQTDPAFHGYVLVATATACLMPPPDASCDRVLVQLDRVQRDNPVIDLLHAQRAAQR
jgi:hypothetical protein